MDTVTAQGMSIAPFEPRGLEDGKNVWARELRYKVPDWPP